MSYKRTSGGCSKAFLTATKPEVSILATWVIATVSCDKNDGAV